MPPVGVFTNRLSLATPPEYSRMLLEQLLRGRSSYWLTNDGSVAAVRPGSVGEQEWQSKLVACRDPTEAGAWLRSTFREMEALSRSRNGKASREQTSRLREMYASHGLADNGMVSG